MIDPALSDGFKLIDFATSPSLYNVTLLLLVTSLALVFLITRMNKWAAYAQTHKIQSRLILFLILFVPLNLLNITVTARIAWRTPVHLVTDNTILTSSAIKIGIHGIYLQSLLDARLSAEERTLSKCVSSAISWQTISVKRPACGKDSICAMPIWDIQTILSAIQKAQAEKLPLVRDACEKVTPAMLARLEKK